MYFTDEKSVNYSLSQSFNENIPAGDKIRAVIGAFYINKNQELLYQWFTKNFDRYVKVIPQIYQSSMPYLMSSGCQPENVKMLSEFYKGKGEIYQTALAKTLEVENNCLALKLREQKAFNSFLSKYQPLSSH